MIIIIIKRLFFFHQNTDIRTFQYDKLTTHSFNLFQFLEKYSMVFII
jgi:hypothetical protein